MAKIYLTAAAGFAVAILLAQHPAFFHHANVADRSGATRGARASLAVNDQTFAHGDAVPHARMAENVEPAATTSRRSRRHISSPRDRVEPAPPRLAIVLPRAQLTRVAAHFGDSLTREMFAHFDLFLFVSKAAEAPIGQRMYVFQKQGRDELVMIHNWPVSTGREKFEIAPNGTVAPSFTPAGYYELDPHRMYVHHFSGQWHQPMPYAMFFNWENHGYQTGLAIHGAAADDIKFLGSRSSAGCIHLAPQNAALLFHLIRSQYKGMVPRFAFDRRTATMSNDGMLMHDRRGRLKMVHGYKVLVVIENYDGERMVAALL
ncbi:MAG TPA: L,D-transpeptidase [Rhizomicrobium sp.]